jgi:hypothetical protein
MVGYSSFHELRALERKHMMSINDSTLRILTANPNLSTISALEGLEDQIKQSPMKQVWEASAGDADIELPKPPVIQHLKIIEMLSAACAAKVEEVGDEQDTRAVKEYERGIAIAGRSTSHTSNGRLRIKLASLQVTWNPFSQHFNA